MNETVYNNRGYGCVTIAISLVAILSSLFALATVDVGECYKNADCLSITVLGSIVTFLVAWQIWQTIASREEIKDAINATYKANKIAEDVAELSSEFKNSLNLLAAYRSSSDGLSFLLSGQHYKAFHLFATAITDSLLFANDHERCAMGAFVNLEHCMDFSSEDVSAKEFQKNWDVVVSRLQDIEIALCKASQENALFQTMAKKRIDKFKEAARSKGFAI